MTPSPAAPIRGKVPAGESLSPPQIRGIVARHDNDRGGLIAILEEVQAACGYLPEQALRTVAEATGRSLVDVYGIATFYRSFSLAPRGEHLICGCLGTACHVRGAPRVVEELQRQLGIQAGQTTSDAQFTLETVNCLGACALGPIVVVDGHYFANVRIAKVADILRQAREGLDQPPAGTDESAFPMEVHCSRCNRSLMDPEHPVDGLPSIGVLAFHGGRYWGLSLSCLYGSSSAACEGQIPPGSLVELFCPHCCGELAGVSRCTECEAPMAPMIVRGGGIVQICTRRGCNGRRLDLNGPDG